MDTTNEDLNFERWESAIGKLILACSAVEYELTQLYAKHMPDRDYHEDSYESRFDKSIGVAKTSLKNGEQIAEWLILMKQAAKYRHMVAHNPIHYSSASGTWHIFDLKIARSQLASINLLTFLTKSATLVSI